MSALAGPREVRAELLAPAELDAALAASPVAYLPLGSLEYHGPHLPIGLDALNAHGVCIAAAKHAGGIVLPPVYQGLGGGHTDYPWTVMMPTDTAVRQNLWETLIRLEQFHIKAAMLFTGHFADEQLALVDEVAAAWNLQPDRAMHVHGTGVNRCDTAALPPDHAGAFETSLLYSFHPDLVHLDLLPAILERPSIEPDGNPWGLHRHDSSHPLWGVFGPDPRAVDLSKAAELSDALARWLAALAHSRLP